jgi:hypothetical protein
MIFDFNYNSDQVSFGKRAQLAMTHVLNIPEKLLNVIAQLAKLILFGIAAGLTFGQSKLLNEEVKLAAKRVVTNVVGLGTSAIGFFAPINAMEWQTKLVGKMFEAKPSKALFVAGMLSV